MAPPFSTDKADAVVAAATRLLSEVAGTAGLTCPDGSVMDAARGQLRDAFTIAVCACVVFDRHPPAVAFPMPPPPSLATPQLLLFCDIDMPASDAPAALHQCGRGVLRDVMCVCVITDVPAALRVCVPKSKEPREK